MTIDSQPSDREELQAKLWRPGGGFRVLESKAHEELDKATTRSSRFGDRDLLPLGRLFCRSQQLHLRRAHNSIDVLPPARLRLHQIRESPMLTPTEWS